MEILLSDELRLVYALLLQAAVLAGAWRFVSRRVKTDFADRAADILLLNFCVQYLAVVLPGWAELLSPLSIAVFTLILSAGLFFAPGVIEQDGEHSKATAPNPLQTDESHPRVEHRPSEIKGGAQPAHLLNYRTKGSARPKFEMVPKRPFPWVLLACALFGFGYAGTMAWNQRLMPVTANDALTYHFPAAVQWLHTHRISLYETWFFNPANTYSPLAGSTFIAWWIAPLGNDVLARHEQVPALLLIFFASLRLMRGLGVRTNPAAIIALAILLSKPFLRQAQMEKDDLYLTAFFACAVAGLAKQRLEDRLGGWRLGISLGLLLATKYTALLALPLFLLAIDAPIRARWPLRRYGLATAVSLLLAGPWYLRNAMLTGNPLYPLHVKLFGHTILPGLFASARSQQFSSPGSIWQILTQRDQSLPAILLLALLAGAVLLMILRFRSLRSEPLLRLTALGPLIGILIFLIWSPYSEVRFLDPSFLLLFCAAGAAISLCIRPAWVAIVVASVFLFLSWFMTYRLEGAYVALILEIVAIATLCTTLGLGIAWFLRAFPQARVNFVRYGVLSVCLVASGMIYMWWNALMIKTCRNSVYEFYRAPYEAKAQVWQYIRDQIPPTEALAYTNTVLVHPMYGFEHDRPVFYLPTRRNISHISDLPAFATPLSGEQIQDAMATALSSDTDADGWLKRLFASPATHIAVYHDQTAHPPEDAIIAAHPERFERVFENAAGSVYRLRK